MRCRERSTDGQVPAPPVPRELGKPGEELTLDVTAYSVDENAPRAAAQPPCLSSTQRFTGPGRSYEDLVNAASAVTRYLQRELGYYLGYAYLPEQVPVNGVIRDRSARRPSRRGDPQLAGQDAGRSRGMSRAYSRRA